MRDPSNTLFYDLEVTPTLAWVYDFYEANVVRMERESHIMCFSYKWKGEDEIFNVAQPDYPSYKKDPYSDRLVVRALWRLLDDADIVVAHNAHKFDNKVSQARFMAYGLTPPSHYKTVDTLTSARRYFKFGSNSLGALCERLGIGSKSGVTHVQLWYDCLNGDEEAWRLMGEYCNQDVALLEGLYDKLAPYITNHPNVALISGKEDGCPRCGSSRLQYRGYAYTNVSAFRKVCCQDCGAWSRVRVAEKDKSRPTFVTVVS